MTFYVAMNEGSASLSCKTTLLLGLIQLRPRLDYLPPRASLITSSADHPKRNLVHLDTKKLIGGTFYVAMNNGNVLLSCKTTLLLDLIQPRPRLDYLTPRASLITSSVDHPKNKSSVTYTETRSVHSNNKVRSGHPNTSCQEKVSKLITSKEMILHEYPDVFEEIGKFLGPDYYIQIDPSIPFKQTPC